MTTDNKTENETHDKTTNDLEGIIKKRVRLLIPYSEKDIPIISEKKIEKMAGDIISEQDKEQTIIFETDKDGVNKIIYFGYNTLTIPPMEQIKEHIRESIITTLKDNELEEITKKYYAKLFKITIDYFGGTPNIEPFFNSALTYNQLESLFEPKKGDKGIDEARFLISSLESTKELLEKKEVLITVIKDEQGEEALYFGLENPYLPSIKINITKEQESRTPYKNKMSPETKIGLLRKKEYLEVMVDLEIDNKIRIEDKVISNINDLKGTKINYIKNKCIESFEVNHGMILTELLIRNYGKPAKIILQAYIDYLKEEIDKQKEVLIQVSNPIEEGLRAPVYQIRKQAFALLIERRKAFETIKGLKRVVDNYEERKKIEEAEKKKKPTGQ